MDGTRVDTSERPWLPRLHAGEFYQLYQIVSFCPLEVKNLLTADSTWKERTSLQRMQTMEAPKTAGHACPPASPPARNLANTERLFYWTSWVGF